MPDQPKLPLNPEPCDFSWRDAGTVGRPHGLAGAFFLSRSLAKGTPVRIDGCHGIMTVVENREGVVRVTGVAARSEVERLRGKRVWVLVSESESRAGSDDTGALIGATVVAAGSESVVGRIVEVYNFGTSTDTVEIEHDDRRILLPLIEEYFKFSPSFEKVVLTQDPENLGDLWYSSD